jgi:hypothetical protein
MNCNICNQPITEGLYGKSKKGVSHKDCYEKEHFNKRGRRPEWIFIGSQEDKLREFKEKVKVEKDESKYIYKPELEKSLRIKPYVGLIYQSIFGVFEITRLNEGTSATAKCLRAFPVNGVCPYGQGKTINISTESELVKYE